MKKLLTLVVTTIVSIYFLSNQAFALTLDTIGSSSTTNGKPGTQWYYTSQNPRLSGTAVASSTVTITIDNTAYTTTANSSGAWSYTPTTLTTGDHSVVIAGDGTSFSTTFHIGQNVPSTTTKGGTSASGSAQLPVTGAVENTILVLGAGAVMILVGIKLHKALA